VSPVGPVGEAFADRGYEIEEFLVVPEHSFHEPGVEVVFPDPLAYDAIVPMGAPWSVYDESTIGAWVLEEIGLVRRLGAPLIVDWLPPYLGWDDAVEFIFDGGVLQPDEVAAMRLAPGEIVSAHWLTADEAAAHVSPLAARRLSWLDTEKPATTAYFEDGRPAL